MVIDPVDWLTDKTCYRAGLGERGRGTAYGGSKSHVSDGPLSVCHSVFFWVGSSQWSNPSHFSLCDHTTTHQCPRPSMSMRADKPSRTSQPSRTNLRSSNARIQHATLIPPTRYRPAKKHAQLESLCRPRRSRPWSDMPEHQGARLAMISTLARSSNL